MAAKFKQPKEQAEGEAQAAPSHLLRYSAFETAMRRSRREKGFFVSFDYTQDALQEIDRFFKADHAIIIPLTVQEILDDHIARKLA